MNINEETATKIMGWEKREFSQWVNTDGDNEEWFSTLWVPKELPPLSAEELWDSDHIAYNVTRQKHMAPYKLWRPDQDRNQSRMVVEKTIELVGGKAVADALVMVTQDIEIPEPPTNGMAYLLIHITPKQECLACLRAIEKVNE